MAYIGDRPRIEAHKFKTRHDKPVWDMLKGCYVCQVCQQEMT